MKWDFFYDEGKDSTYDSLTEWYKDVKHVIKPVILVIALGALVYYVIFYF